MVLMVCVFCGFGGVERLQRDVERVWRFWQSFQHLLGRRRIGIVGVQHGHVRDVEALRFVVEFRVQEFLARWVVDGFREQVVYFRG